MNENAKSEERLITRIFILILTGCIIGVGFYIFLSENQEIVTIYQPTIEQYRNLYRDHAQTLRCPSSQLATSYETFFNVTFVLHQVCSSDFVSFEWLNYLLRFDPTLVPVWTETHFSRDLRIFGASYFQFLATYCSLTRLSIAEVQNMLRTTTFISNNVPSPDMLTQRTEALFVTLNRTTRSNFNRMLIWINIVNNMNNFLSGSNTNFATRLQDNQVYVTDQLFESTLTISNDSVLITIPCSCIESTDSCRLNTFLYKNGTNFSNYARDFKEITLGCIPVIGFTTSIIDWWYEKECIEDIRDTYGIVIHNQTPPAIQPLNLSTSIYIEGQTINDLLTKMFIESIIKSNASFDIFYSQSAPDACSYKVVRRRHFVVALLLLFSVCGGLKNGLRLLIPLIMKSILLCHKRWHNNQIHGQFYSITLILIYILNINVSIFHFRPK